MPQTILTFGVFSGIIILLISILVIYIIYNKQKNKRGSRSETPIGRSPDGISDVDKYVIKERLAQFEAEERAKIEQALSQRRAEIDAEVATLEAAAREKQSQRLADQQREIDSANLMLEEKKKSVSETIALLEASYSEKQKALEQSLADKEQLLLTQQAAVLKNAATTLKAELDKEVAEHATHTQNLRLAAENELNLIKLEIEDFKKKQQVINEEIMRRRQVEEQTDFYRIVLDESSIDDIQILLSIRQNLKNRENLDKLIYDTYISKPVVEMTKRVLKGGAPSGIYKITRLKTGEIYVGKSTDIKKRWTEHAKTAYGVGTIAHSILHTTIKKDGIENFTFELLEEVPKDKLTEREKYWITFYGSKEYGLNERNG